MIAMTFSFVEECVKVDASHVLHKYICPGSRDFRPGGPEELRYMEMCV